MKIKIRISKILQIGLLLTFFLPFFPTGCEEKKAVETASYQIQNDSLNEIETIIESQSNINDTLIENKKINEIDKPKEEITISEKISSKSKILKMLLRPNNNYSGIATIIDFFSLIEFGYGLGIGIVLFLFALIVKFKDFNSIFLYLNLTGILMIIISKSPFNFFNDDKLWGYWVCLICGLIIMIYDIFILYESKKSNKTIAQHHL